MFACVDLQVMKSTGFFRGLYTSQELDAKSIQVHTYMMCVYVSYPWCLFDDSNAMVWVVSVADLGGVRGVQMHPPLAASNVMQCNGLSGVFTLCLMSLHAC